EAGRRARLRRTARQVLEGQPGAVLKGIKRCDVAFLIPVDERASQGASGKGLAARAKGGHSMIPCGASLIPLRGRETPASAATGGPILALSPFADGALVLQ